MNSIKYTILLSFCVTFLIVISVSGALVTFKLNKTFGRQSEILSKDLRAMTDKTLESNYNVFESTFRSIARQIEHTSRDISGNPNIIKNIEAYQGVAINSFLESFKDEIDFAVIFDLKGYHIASFPSDVGHDVDVQWIENHYKTCTLGKKIQNFLQDGSFKIQDQDIEHNLLALEKHDFDFIKAFSLTDRNFSGDNFLTMLSAKIIHDDFGDPLAVLIAGKVLNDFNKPLKDYYDATGLVCAVYSDTFPIAHMGFNKPGENGAVSVELQISNETLKKVYEADKPIQIPLTLAGKNYFTMCSAITASEVKKVGIICVGISQEQIIEAEQEFLSFNNESRKSLQVWLLGFGAATFVLFIIISLVISITITNPIKTFTTKVRDIAKGNLSIRTKMKRNDEIGVLSDALDKMAGDFENTQAQLVQSAKLSSIGELASGVAHELNQPLMVIRGNAQLVNRSLRKNRLDPEKIIQRLEPIERNTKRMMNIINHLRTFSRQSQSEFQPVDVNKIIDGSFLMVGEQLRLRNIEVQQDLDADLPKVKGDANQLEQVFLNLITNARDAVEMRDDGRMDEGRGTKDDSIQNLNEFKGRIEISTRLQNSQPATRNQQLIHPFIEILVRDNGGGIPENKVDKIFDPFFTTKEVGQGTGLGLSISYGIIKDHQGQIEVAETGPEGTSFRIRLPNIDG